MKTEDILSGALALIEDKNSWTPYELGVYNAKGEWCSVAKEDTVQYSTKAALERTVAGTSLILASVVYRDIRKAIEPAVVALAATLLQRLKSVQFKDNWNGYPRGGDGRSEYLLHEDLVVGFGSVAGHGGIVALFQETLRRLRNETFPTFEMSIGDREVCLHRVGDPLCDVGHCGRKYPGFSKYPVKCRCGGLIHLAIDPSIEDFDWKETCDKCGSGTRAFDPPMLVVSN